MKQSMLERNVSQSLAPAGTASENGSIDAVRSRNWRLRLFAAVTLLGALVNVQGCADGFTNGGVPPGRSTIIGRVVRADNPQVGASKALVTITTLLIGRGTPTGRGTSVYAVYTDGTGQFEVDGIPTDTKSSNVTVSVTPNDPTLLPQKVAFALANNRPTDVIIALPPVGFPLNKVASVNIVQTSSTNNPVPEAQFTATVLDAAGNSLGIIPTMIFDGGLATINADGTITLTSNPADISPIPLQPLGVVTGTVDTNSTNAPPSSVVTPTLPTTQTAPAANEGRAGSGTGSTRRY